jgi:selenocysteine-specific elongation factor
MYVIGTAGHVDHGKSTLVKALTGIDPDRLKEEKAREMTIDLGFAWLTLPSGKEVSVVDVPGHERFIKNMLAGVGGLDAAMLVIAADEGPMPQTAEHLSILHLLGVDRGVVALTKTDMVDEEWLVLVEEEVRERLKGTTLEGAPIVPVSARTGQGLDALLAALDMLLDATEPRADKGRPRLPIDRVFTMPGFGTIVTGTLTDGTLRAGQEVEIVPSGLRSRVRGLQSHKHKVESIGPGNRVAVNLVGLEVEQLSRGMVVTLPGVLRPSRRVDVHLNLLPDSPVTVEQNDPLDFFSGAAETPAQITLLDTDRLEPGGSAWAQLRLRDEVAVGRGDRFIVRLASPSITVGGGDVIDPHPRRHKRFHDETLTALQTLQRGTPEELVTQALGTTAQDAKAVIEKSGLEREQAAAALRSLVSGGEVMLLSGDDAALERSPSAAMLMSAAAFNETMRRARTLLEHFHRQQPLRRGMSKEELRNRLSSVVPPRAFPHAMAAGAARGLLAEDATTMRLPDHKPTFSPAQQAQVDALRKAHATSPYSPPTPAEMGTDPDVLAALIDSGELVRLDDTIVYTSAALDGMRERILRAIDEQGEVNVATLRDLFGTTRKYAIPLLEYLDEHKVTRRVGDVRVRW